MSTTGLTDAHGLLTDGRTLHVRQVRPADRQELLELNTAASDRSIYLRFFASSRAAADQYVDKLLRPGDGEHRALIGEIDGRVAAVASYERVAAHQAEVAILVADEFQHAGVATLLLEYLASVARHGDIATFSADVLVENGAMLRAFADLGYPMRSDLKAGVERIVLDLAADQTTFNTLDERDRVADRASLHALLHPASVVVIGAGERPRSVGHQVLVNLLEGGFTGTVYAVNPKHRRVAGVACFGSVAELPGTPDQAVIAVPARAVVEAVDNCGRRGVKAVVVLSSGFGELGFEGISEQQRLLDVVRAHGMRLLGPNCLGVLNSDQAVRLNATFAPVPLQPGTVAMASQSGALGIAIMRAAQRCGLGLAQFVSLGNKADISGNDLLLAWAQDPSIQVIALYLESVGNPRKFARIASRVAEHKPVLAIKGGRSQAGQRAGQSHTAAAASDEAIVDALFEQAGVLRTDSMAELLDGARVLAAAPLPAGPRLGIVGNSGGPEILAADAAVAAGLEVSQLSESLQAQLRQLAPGLAATDNPVDLGAGAQASQLEAAVRLLAASGEVDAVLGIVTETLVADFAALTAVFERVAADASTPLVVVRTGEPDQSVPVAAGTTLSFFEFPEPAARSLGLLWRYARIRRATPGLAQPSVPMVTARQLVREYVRRGDSWLAAADAVALLDCYGVEVCPFRRVTDTDQACAAAAELGYPVALKAGGHVVHKTEVGGVRTNLANEEQVRQAFAAVARAGDGVVIVQPMIEGDIEIVVGGVQDAQVGPVVMVGAGGVLTDLLDDRRFRLAPVTDQAALEAVSQLRIARLLAGYRGRRPVSDDAVAELLVRVGRLMDDLPQVAELDLNPVIGRGAQLIVVDPKIRVAPGAERPDPAIRLLR
ncbi:MAG TPA: GNAT family N-acetyltransferase [Jatrophihabitans sp.]|nr:GNAT family N-acetyltransferase [Jatrophihabitans sp.]